MVWNVTKDSITERMAVLPEDAWPVPSGAQVFADGSEEVAKISDADIDALFGK